ncbi:MAG: LIC_13355 family lipoprotein [Alphaproteobacteria bacterium]|nr:LIC_13355 family lipoprotein [Alphaproteobacteria bacterium]
MIALLLACAPEVPWADGVVVADGAGDGAFGDPDRAANGARGAGCCQGGIDVYSLSPALGRTELVLSFGTPVLDGSGDDLAVFENPFEIADGSGRFMDPVVVSVSADGDAWATFPHEYAAPDPTAWSADPTHWVGFAGVTPVLLNEDEAPADPADRDAAGGDGFDLATLPESPATADVLARGARFVRLVPASLVDDPRTGAAYPADPVSDGPDIDAVYGW